MKKDFLGLGAVIIILAIIGLFFMIAPDASPDFGPVEVDIGLIEVDDQYDLNQVYLYVENSEPGFVTIHESMDIAPGETIGISEYFYDGSYDYTIDLTSTMIPGDTYIAILHVDDGDEVFNMDDDMAAMVNGEVVRPSFEAGYYIETENE